MEFPTLLQVPRPASSRMRDRVPPPAKLRRCEVSSRSWERGREEKSGSGEKSKSTSRRGLNTVGPRVG
ncbi:hypothetical protein E2562_035645 [Oryza meyeriana var. granulata]|uniref:Uncharacterized protein n=1 Tax=Oryza meyeriana var. granulata TaxID=110450 RepID=A0A6G1E9C1_9ORYZ|nr:hypothetical protein E2562_035645 [Oryza meyeriana var. granulata]